LEKEQKLIEILLANSAYFPKSYDIETRKITFCGMTKNSFIESSFLSEKLLQASKEDVELDLDLMLKVCSTPALHSQVNYIFHTALCGSTLLARSLEFGLDNFHVLKEPHVLHLLSIQQRKAIGNPELLEQSKKIFSLIMQLLSRPLTPGQNVVIKPTNHASNLVWQLLNLNKKNRAVYLYSDLNDFLISCLKQEAGRKTDMRAVRRQWLSELLNTLCSDFAWLGEYNSNTQELTHAELAAICWFAQMKNVENILAADTESKVQVVNFLQLLTDPGVVLDLTLSHFEVTISPERIAEAVSHPALTRHSKLMHKTYSSEKYFEEKTQLMRIHDGEIEQGLNIVDKLASRHSLPSFFHTREPDVMSNARR
jgi:hypothetical protein